jgi:electron-transferring-flavoprotein dehydrogenase
LSNAVLKRATVQGGISLAPLRVLISSDDAPNHIRVRRRVSREVVETWAWMCPAGVYEIPEDEPESGEVEVIVNRSNCVQRGAITAKGGRLTPPEGGDPLYQNT